MPNPTITPFTTNTAPYTVSQSDYAYYDLEITDLSDDAQFLMTVPARTVEVDAWTLAGAETTIRWNPAGIETRLLPASPSPATPAWVTGPVTVGPWSLTISSDPDVTQQVIIIINSPGPTGSLRVRARGLAGASVFCQADSDTRMVRILADPTISGTPQPQFTPVVERSNCTLLGNPQLTMQASASIPGALVALPVVTGVWEKISSDPTFSLVQAPPNATFKVPGVYADTTFSFRFRAYYDLNSNGLYDSATEPDTSQGIDVTFIAVHHRMVAVLDRSGSMSGTLPGGAESKWDAAKRASHIWLDLFAAFRAPADQTAGFITFEDDSCGYGPPATAADVTFRDPSTGAASAGLVALSTFSSLTGLNLGDPQTCTPIGDAVKRAFQSLDAPPLTDVDACTILLLTDGYENSGAVSIKSPNPGGTTYIGANLAGTLQAKLAIYVIGCGDSVDEDSLNNLPGLAALDLVPNGYYRLAPQVQDLLPSFAQMLGNSVDAQDLGAVVDGTLLFATCGTNAGETRLVIVVPWDQPSHSLNLSRRDPATVPWTPVPIGTNVTLAKRDTHAILAVDLPGLLGPGAPAQEWRVEWVNGAAVAQPLKFGVLAVVDLHCKMDIEFDKTAYATGEPIRVTARLNAGNEVITGATVIAEVAGPGEGLGTFMSNNGSQLAGPVTLANLREGRLPEVLKAASAGPDVQQPKAALFNYYLSVNHLEALPTVNSLFVDGTDRLFDDGSHSDGPANDGVYANTFSRTDKEGTYTFRFRAEGTLSDGSHFRRVITISKWVGVKVDPASSPVSLTAAANAPPGLLGQVIVVTPHDRRGEYLGPFRDGQVSINATAGSFSGPVETRLDGRYVRTLFYKREEQPVITVSVDGTQVYPKPSDLEGCFKAVLTILKHLLEALKSVTSPSHWRKLMFWKK